MSKIVTLVVLLAVVWSSRATQCSRILAKGVKIAQRSLIVDLQNEERAKVAAGLETRGSNGPQPPAANMGPLTWDRALAGLAQSKANECEFTRGGKLSEARFMVGQNRFFTVSEISEHADANWTRVVQRWSDQAANVDRNKIAPYRPPASMFTEDYTQMVWAKTKFVGCGFVKYRSNSNNWYNAYYVCTYGPLGNVVGANMYELKSV